MSYNPNEIEAKWQKKWDDEKAFEPDDALARKK
jgi:leucyl-tRNA synthetase